MGTPKEILYVTTMTLLYRQIIVTKKNITWVTQKQNV